MTRTASIPLWIILLSAGIALLALFVGGSLYAAPAAFMPEIDFSAPGVAFLAQMWAARQIAIALILLLSLLRRSAPLLQLSLLAYSLMNLQDAVIGLMRHDQGLVGGASFFFLLSAAMVLILRKRCALQAITRYQQRSVN